MALNDRKRHLCNLLLLRVSCARSCVIQRQQFAIATELRLYVHAVERAAASLLEMRQEEGVIGSHRCRPGGGAQSSRDLYLFGDLRVGKFRSGLAVWVSANWLLIMAKPPVMRSVVLKSLVATVLACTPAEDSLRPARLIRKALLNLM